MPLNTFLTSRVCFNILRAYSDWLFCVPRTPLNPSYSPKTLKYLPRNLRIRRKNTEYSERKIHFQLYLGTLKWQHFKKTDWGLYSCLDRTNKKYIFCLFLQKNNFKEQNLSICQLIIPNMKKTLNPLFLTYMGYRSQKTISGNCPFKKSYNMRRTPLLSLSPLNICL